MNQLVKDIKKKQNQIYDVKDCLDKAICLYDYFGTHYSPPNIKDIKEVYIQLGKYLNVIESNLNNILYED